MPKNQQLQILKDRSIHKKNMKAFLGFIFTSFLNISDFPNKPLSIFLTESITANNEDNL